MYTKNPPASLTTIAMFAVTVKFTNLDAPMAGFFICWFSYREKVVASIFYFEA